MLKSTLILFAKGFAMGSADLVPGISGATIALVLNVYHPFIQSIKRILSLESLKLLWSREWQNLVNYVNLKFITPLVMGIFTCIFSLAFVIAYLLENYPIPFWAFFFGLILASSLVLPNYSTRFYSRKIFLFITGIVVGYFLISLNTFETPDTYLMIFLAGMVAIGAMVLPGISGSFMLLILGKYQLLIYAIKDLDIELLLVFSMGAGVSLIIVPRIVDLILKNGRDLFIVFVAGFLLGSLKKIWPWRLTEPITNKEIVVSPFYYQNILNQDHQLLSAILMFFLGVALILAVRYLEKRTGAKTSKNFFNA